MSPWLTYGLLGVVAGPFVIAAGASVTRCVPLSWRLASRPMWVPMLAASMLLGVALAAVAQRQPAEAGALSWLVIMGLLLTLIDWTCHRIPHALVGMLLGGGVIQFGVTGLGSLDGVSRLLQAAAATAAVFVIAVTMALVSPRGWGLGDVTLSSAVAFFLGWFSWWHVAVGLFAAFALGALTFGVLRARRTYQSGLLIPFGPALVFASVATILLM
jgi:leader peptidase (prepilin peptidase)/N-methyltransferase